MNDARTDACRSLHVVAAQRPRPGGFASAVRLAADMRELVGRWLWRRHYRDELAHLSAHQLRDMGLDRDELWREANKPFWRA